VDRAVQHGLCRVPRETEGGVSMGNEIAEGHRGALPESWAAPFRKALALRGRPDARLQWYLIWARRFAAYLSGRSLHLAIREDAEGFLSMLASSPGNSAWQVEQATDAVTILLGSVFGQEWARTTRIPAPPPPRDVPLPKGDDPVGRLRYAIRCRRYPVRTLPSHAFRTYGKCSGTATSRRRGSTRTY
jgi:hypothetical protein